MESFSIMLEAPALSVQRVSELIVTSVAAFIATEPGAYSSSRLTPGVLPTISCRGFWRRSRADKRCRSAGAICESRDRVVPDKTDRRRLHAQTRPASTEHVAPISKAPAITERLQWSPRRRWHPRFTHVVWVHGSANHGVATPAPPLATAPARRQPALTRVALTSIETAHITHSRHRLPLAARIHSNTRAPADTFLLPARTALAKQDLLVARGGRRDPWFVLPAS